MNELKPCPFCGEKINLYHPDGLLFANCRFCGAFGPLEDAEEITWNTRTDPVKAQMLEALKNVKKYGASAYVEDSKPDIKFWFVVDQAIEAAEKEEI